jgi:SAM-dependent methyltransferase
MMQYNQASSGNVLIENQRIEKFPFGDNIDDITVDSFGEEWSAFHTFSNEEISVTGSNYFDIVPENFFNSAIKALDVGCGTGRWSYYLSDKVGFIECIDPSKAIISAAHLLKGKKNIRISNASVDNIPFEDSSFDLVFSLGVLHHVPDTADAIKKCVNKIKQDGFILLYLYYNLENRGVFFKTLFHLSNSIRWIVSKQIPFLKKTVCDILAILFYLPFIFTCRLLLFFNVSEKKVSKIPLYWYVDKTFRMIRNDSLDRFGTPLEQRFSKKQITDMLIKAGCKDIVFGDKAPFWRVIAKKI